MNINHSSSIAPCGICGGKVREHRVRGEMTLADATPPIEIERECSNPECASRTGEKTLADAV